MARGEFAIEEVVDLDPEDDREFPVTNDFSSLYRRTYDPEPT